MENFPEKTKSPEKAKRIPAAEYWEVLKAEFLPFYACYPESGRMEWLDCVKRYKTIRKGMQRMGAARFLGVVERMNERAWNGYPPKLLKFLRSEDWRKLPMEAMAGIERSLPALEKAVDRKVKKYTEAA